ncbi:hypothetical protein Xmau_00907 [Xenorhabdus mauleonii]|uniref:Uncharacterized protein n=1 Tax=Xenorhabdus mauleonii TaxID=351675 RepID=A0A1I3LNY2_9GAMM|nr:hypothetical protein Xmau_00907 [Xenorhabdus mauleonii]SFI86468.1 hypothetical protein SAMN05421680_10424 [Xenorhabdus mauleonii]
MLRLSRNEGYKDGNNAAGHHNNRKFYFSERE